MLINAKELYFSTMMLEGKHTACTVLEIWVQKLLTYS